MTEEVIIPICVKGWVELNFNTQSAETKELLVTAIEQAFRAGMKFKVEWMK